MEALFVLFILLLLIIALPVISVIRLKKNRRIKKGINNGTCFHVNITINED